MTLNLQQDPVQKYLACPFCFAKVTEAGIEADNKLESVQVETALPIEEPTRNKEKPHACQYHLGYLSERERSQQIPDECIICQDIVECMLRKMRT